MTDVHHPKAKSKTRAAQRKGALTNWKKTGRTIIKYLRKRDISGDDLRRELWVHEEASTPKKKKKTGRGYDINLNAPKVANGTADPAKPKPDVKVSEEGKLPPIDQPQANGHGAANGAANGVCKTVLDVDSMKTPGGGIKKTKQQRREALFKKKRAKSALSRKVQSIDMGLYPVDTDSSDEDLFTGNVWWEVAGQLEGEGVDNAAFEPDSRVQFISTPAPAPAPARAPPAPAPVKPPEPEKKDPPSEPPADPPAE